MEVSMKSLAPQGKGGILNLVFLGLGLAVAGFVAWNGFLWLNQQASNFGLTSAIGLEGISLTEGEETISLGGALGIGTHPYNTATFSMAVKSGDGGAPASISQYIWDVEPQNWGNSLEIDNDYTTPKGADGSSIDIPSTATITNGTMTATLASNLATQSPQVDSKGNVIISDRTYYVHGLVTGAPDLFF